MSRFQELFQVFSKGLEKVAEKPPEMLGGEYDILQAENGVEAVEMIRLHETELSLVLLDIVIGKSDIPRCAG